MIFTAAAGPPLGTAPSSFAPATGENSPVRPSEVGVAQGVTDGVDGTVQVTQPVSEVVQFSADALVYEGIDDGEDVVRSPGDDEGQEDGAEGLGRLALLLLPVSLLLRPLGPRRPRRRRRRSDRDPLTERPANRRRSRLLRRSRTHRQAALVDGGGRAVFVLVVVDGGGGGGCRVDGSPEEDGRDGRRARAGWLLSNRTDDWQGKLRRS